MPREAMSYTLPHHYSVLGLDRLRSEPFSDAEIKEEEEAAPRERKPEATPVNHKQKLEAQLKPKDVQAVANGIGRLNENTRRQHSDKSKKRMKSALVTTTDHVCLEVLIIAGDMRT